MDNTLQKTAQEYSDQLVGYTKNEEIANFVTHFAGAIFAWTSLVVMLVLAKNTYAIIASICFSFGMILTYTNSSIYHGIKNLRMKVIWRKVDHCSVCFVIFACGAPLCLCLSNHIYNYICFALCLFIAILGSTLCYINLKKFSRLALVMDFLSAFLLVGAFFVDKNFIPFYVQMIYLSGTISCFIGSLFFGRKKEYMHAVFHTLELIGTILYFFASILILNNFAG